MVNKKKKHNQVIVIAIVIVSCVALDGFVWHAVVASFFVRFEKGNATAHDYFLNVGQGVSELTVFPDGMKMMTDAGSDATVVGQLESVLPQGDDYIDLAIISDPLPDDFGGYDFVLDHYRVGAFIYDGREADGPSTVAWGMLLAKIKDKNIPLVTLGSGDVIHYDNGNNRDAAEINILSPNASFAESPALTDASLVLLVKTPQFSTLLMPDAGANIAEALIAQHDDIRADVLGLSDQVSANPSQNQFLRTVNPAALIVSPMPKTNRVQSASSSSSSPSSFTSVLPNALILITAQNGTIEIYPENGKLKVIKDK